MFTDQRRYEVWNEIRQHDMRSFASKITATVIAEAAKRTGLKLVKSPLCLGNLVWLAIACALHRGLDFAAVLTMTMKLLQDQQEFSSTHLGKQKKSGKARKKRSRQSKHHPRGNDPTEVSEEAFAKARARMPLAFWVNLIIILGEMFQREHASLLTFHGFRLLAIDGTCLDLGHRKALKQHFGTASNGKSRQQAQARMVMLQFPHTRLPYRYELCPLDQGEVTIARRLAKHLQANDLLLLDACFWSYGLFWDLQRQGAFFALPLKRKRMNLERIGRLDRRDELMRWTPQDSRGQWRKEKLPKSMDLRVITYNVPGFRSQKLVTNVLDGARVPRQEWVRLAQDCSEEGRFQPGVYHRRWEIETSYRELKVEQGMNDSLRSRTPASIQWEVAGQVILYLLLRWLIVEAAVKHGIDPLRLSFKNALRELLEIHQSLVTANGRWVGVLLGRLLDRISSHRVPYRPGRSYPRRKQSTNHKRKTKDPSKPTKSKSKRQAAKQHNAKSKKKG